jgi:peptidoglycan/xylan/chitin deacetylase (PgdA/CDA1 family)
MHLFPNLNDWLAGLRTPGTTRLPILSYHRVATAGRPELAPWRVPPDAFEEHLRYLRSAGYRSVTLDQWLSAVRGRGRLPERPVLLTFDDGYQDFEDDAWPLLRRYGFSATVFLVSGRIGGMNDWDGDLGGDVPVLTWSSILQLQRQGVVFGSHSVTHPRLTTLSPEQVAEQGRQSRALLERRLGRPVQMFAYPYGDLDDDVVRLIGECGYRFALTCRTAAADKDNALLELPRIEVAGSDGVRELEQKLCPPIPT